jgi:hypothetical protein
MDLQIQLYVHTFELTSEINFELLIAKCRELYGMLNVISDIQLVSAYCVLDIRSTINVRIYPHQNK